MKIEPEEEKPAKGKTSRDHHDGKVGNSLHLQDTCNSKFLLNFNFRPIVKSEDQKVSFLISQPKHMLWVLKRTSQGDGSFEHTKHVKTNGRKIFKILLKIMFI